MLIIMVRYIIRKMTETESCGRKVTKQACIVNQQFDILQEIPSTFTNNITVSHLLSLTCGPFDASRIEYPPCV
jgi:hypothetical protein